jgi:hypothetical protein
MRAPSAHLLACTNCPYPTAHPLGLVKEAKKGQASHAAQSAAPCVQAAAAARACEQRRAHLLASRSQLHVCLRRGSHAHPQGVQRRSNRRMHMDPTHMSAQPCFFFPKLHQRLSRPQPHATTPSQAAAAWCPRPSPPSRAAHLPELATAVHADSQHLRPSSRARGESDPLSFSLSAGFSFLSTRDRALRAPRGG